MNYIKLQNIDKQIFTADDLSRILSIERKSAQVMASRYVDSGFFIRLKRNLYSLSQNFENPDEETLFRIANLLQTPSYISLTTALSYYNISTQQTPEYIESVGLKRTTSFKLKNYDFNYTLVKKEFYFGFERTNNFFIASPEKAFSDSVYLTAIGKYNADFEAIDFDRINKKVIETTLNKTNKAAQNLWQKLIKTYKL